ncbi:AbrB/MazE/SpoVT family DNA-binding domain-containing protein [Brevifollis gellanilyticus]|uniref:SpoVT-AbrB domain-containing protein n=1 Tax=Brevifollis gellanilyticus TaxID=748831 RepID=A0A512MFL4_9BACT|nr:hypothetical protein [Brevifollis gellanilyticus]GEP45530.1 hypothetical protein BGE01nite_48210 [Brevifollis gellanilyticus]
MIQTITKIGNTQGIILDPTLLEQAGLELGDEVNVEVLGNGIISIKPISIGSRRAGQEARRLIQKNDELFRRLS